jgi:hypothetical protein
MKVNTKNGWLLLALLNNCFCRYNETLVSEVEKFFWLPAYLLPLSFCCVAHFKVLLSISIIQGLYVLGKDSNFLFNCPMALVFY